MKKNHPAYSFGLAYQSGIASSDSRFDVRILPLIHHLFPIFHSIYLAFKYIDVYMRDIAWSCPVRPFERLFFCTNEGQIRDFVILLTDADA